MPLTLMRQDITRLQVDAIVNAANEGLRAGGGVCGAIFAAAGHDQLQAACDEIGHVDTGSAVATPAFALPARHVIHTAGPIWRGGGQGERDLLASCYRSSMELARKLGDASIAFPLISSGIYGYPPAQALSVAVREIRSFLEADPDLEVTLCLFDRRATTITQGTFGAIEQFIDDTYIEQSPYARRDREGELLEAMQMQAPDQAMAAPQADSMAQPSLSHSPSLAPRARSRRRKRVDGSAKPALDEALRHLDAPFSQLLLAMIDERGLTDSQVYGRANLSRQYFSKLRSGSINPSKRVVVSLAIALELSLDETRALLERAGHALSHASKFDVIVEWFIREGRYDVFEINEALFAFDQPLLGAS